jgi:hypothetical protein
VEELVQLNLLAVGGHSNFLLQGTVAADHLKNKAGTHCGLDVQVHTPALLAMSNLQSGQEVGLGKDDSKERTLGLTQAIF